MDAFERGVHLWIASGVYQTTEEPPPARRITKKLNNTGIRHALRAYGLTHGYGARDLHSETRPTLSWAFDAPPTAPGGKE